VTERLDFAPRAIAPLCANDSPYQCSVCAILTKGQQRNQGDHNRRRHQPRRPQMPNFTALDMSLPEVATLVAAMVQARDAVSRRSWSHPHPQEPTGEDWWADVLADPRVRKRERRADLAVKQAFYRLADERREIILVACSKCDWRAAFSRAELIASHGADYPMPNLLDHLAAPSCSRLGSHWDRCGVHYVKPIEGAR
jgi:hypothetical protein